MRLQSNVQITGAFGWTLGDKLPASDEMQETSDPLSSEPYNFSDIGNTNTPPFEYVSLSCVQDRTIYQIQASADIKYKDGILAALKSKYGEPAFHRVMDYDNYDWTSGGRSLGAMCWKNPDGIGDVIVVYEDRNILSNYRSELEKKDAADNQNISSNLVPKL
ncbi:MAG TPA: hypothetical protein VFC44_07770 [Candidatus Saccharimonadales bacterium]|nr:hypothetical protein [Candidatus Saccharimonadales bacterium]